MRSFKEDYDSTSMIVGGKFINERKLKVVIVTKYIYIVLCSNVNIEKGEDAKQDKLMEALSSLLPLPT